MICRSRRGVHSSRENIGPLSHKERMDYSRVEYGKVPILLQWVHWKEIERVGTIAPHQTLPLARGTGTYLSGKVRQ